MPVVSTFHGRLDLPWADETLATPTPGLVAISENQASTHPNVAWAGIVHNGLTLDDAPFERRRSDALCFVGRVAPEKGIVEAIEIATMTGRPLRIAAKAGPTVAERDYFENVFEPARKAAGSLVEFLGELEGRERDQLFAESYATLMPGSWPEPFGLVAIEALACGTPIVARRVGGLPEIIRDGIDGFFGDDQRAARLPRRPRRRSRPGGDPRVRPGTLLGRPDDRRLRGHLPRPARSRRRRRPGTPGDAADERAPRLLPPDLGLGVVTALQGRHDVA